MRAIKQRNRLPQSLLDDRIKQGVQTKEKIFRIIANSEPIGKSSADLRKETGLSRDRIHTLCKEYIDKGELYKTARYGVYRLTQKALQDPASKGFFFDSQIKKALPRAEFLCAVNKFCNTPLIQDVVNDSTDNERTGGGKLGLRRDPHIKDKLSLFEFALNIGAIITFEMLKGIEFASNCQELNNKDRVARDWIDNVIHPNVILSRFAHIPEIEQRLSRNNPHRRPYPFYDMDSEDVASLMQSFNDVFPQVYNQSQDILSDLQSKIDSARQHAKEMVERDRGMETEDPKHTKCDGQLIPEIKTRLDGTKVQQCTKCHRWIKMKKPKSTA